jgi:hypothetical protein
MWFFWQNALREHLNRLRRSFHCSRGVTMPGGKTRQRAIKRKRQQWRRKRRQQQQRQLRRRR